MKTGLNTKEDLPMEKQVGLTGQEVEERIRSGQVNRMENHMVKTNKEIVKAHLLTYFNFLNLFLAILVLITGQFKNMTFMGVVIVNAVIGIVQELKVKKVVDKLTVLTASKAHVVREGEKYEIDIEEVVKDDILIVINGDQICADCTVLECDGLEVNESMLTGESKPVKKKAGDELMSGSFVVAGGGVGRVVHVGDENYAAELTRKAKTKKRATSEMQNTIKRIIAVISILIIPIGILLFRSQISAQGMTRNEAIVATVAGIIGMIPEGLVLLTSISFILGVGRLAKKRALVQEMEAIEALARVNVLCLDKTGTITTGELEVTEVLGLGEVKKEEVSEIMNELTFAFEDSNNTQEALKRYFHRMDRFTVVQKIPFSSERKYRAIEFEEKGCYVLGAPEFLLQDDEEGAEILRKVNQYSEEGYRVLLLGKCGSVQAEDGSVSEVSPMGLIVILDCIRKEAPDVFQYFRGQKVEIKVISGDNPVTVSKIAGKAGLLGAEKYVDASTLGDDPQSYREAVQKYNVFGRVKPEQKQKLVHAYQSEKKVVGMVGDGVNDVLALKDADCGIAMAAGSDAAKQSAHIVLLDSDFAHMPSVVWEGRRVVNNVERSASLFLVKNIFSLLMSVFSAVFMITYPLEPAHISLISMFTIGIPGFLLALEPNKERIKGKFIKKVLLKALPAGLTDVFVVGALVICGDVFSLPSADIATAATLLLAVVGFMILIKISEPFNKMKYAILFGNIAGLLFCGIMLNHLFAMSQLSAICMLLLIVFGFAAESLFRYLTLLVEKADEWVEKKSRTRP